MLLAATPLTIARYKREEIPMATKTKTATRNRTTRTAGTDRQAGTAGTAKTTEKDIVKLEKRFWQALQDGDVESALEMTDDPCFLTGAQGMSSIDHETFRSMMQDAPYTLDAFELGDDIQVKILGDDVAIVAYHVKEEMTVEGKPLTLEAADASTWVRRDGRWVCALHTESILGDPFGRDRGKVK
jgi:uncharacterized protein (TIGR02246 family)